MIGTNRFWDRPDIIKLLDVHQGKSEAQLREDLGVSPYDKREVYRLGQTLLHMANEGVIRRDKSTQTYRLPPPKAA